ncbi:unnamed protein product [Ambrosiozyma monospora]|uniref:Unnamed protein product n=1 Tax=Ambrosiozyma monospora TaxID=43982 RepID=A0ACB5SRU6_AMBMO|nr:unnamed protein product [Ambrosiozyma monospora]
MTSLSTDPDVEQFLDNFQELSSTRLIENDNRLSNLEREVERKRLAYKLSPKKKKNPPLVPGKSVRLQSSIGLYGENVERNDLNIDLINPIARPTPDISDLSPHSKGIDMTSSTSLPPTSAADSVYNIMDQLDLNTNFEVPRPKKNEPKAIKADDIMATPVRKDLKFATKDPVNTVLSKVKKETTICDFSDSDDDLLDLIPSSTSYSSHQKQKPKPTPPQSSSSTSSGTSGKSSISAKSSSKLASKKTPTTPTRKSSSKEYTPPLKPSKPSRPSSSSSSSTSSLHRSARTELSAESYSRPSSKHSSHSTKSSNATESSSSKRPSSYKNFKKPTTPTKPKSKRIANLALDDVPLPNEVSAYSASAAAKAPALKPTKVDSTLGERAPDLSLNARFLTNGGASSPPRKQQSPVSLHGSPSAASRIGEKVPDLATNAKFLTFGGAASRSPSPNKKLVSIHGNYQSDSKVGEMAPDLAMNARFLTAGGAASPTRQSTMIRGHQQSERVGEKAPDLAMNARFITSGASHLNRQTVSIRGRLSNDRVGEMVPGLSMNARFLTQGGASSPIRKSPPTVPKKSPKLSSPIPQSDELLNMKPSDLNKKLKPVPVPAPKPTSLKNRETRRLDEIFFE